MDLQFSVPKWSSWEGVAGSASGDSGSIAQPDVSAIPAMLRRRLNLLGRACASQALPFLNENPELPIVYCSQHGDIERTLKILLELAESGEMSPMNFSLAVHNAVCGVLSIQAGVRGPINSIAAGEDYLVPMLLEALGLLQSAYEKVLCIACDVPLPDIYQSPNALPHAPFAAAFVLEKGGTMALELDGRSGIGREPKTQRPALDFCDFLSGQASKEDTNAFYTQHNGAVWALNKLP